MARMHIVVRIEKFHWSGVFRINFSDCDGAPLNHKHTLEILWIFFSKLKLIYELSTHNYTSSKLYSTDRRMLITRNKLEPHRFFKELAKF